MPGPTMQDPSGREARALVPFFDIANHHPVAGTAASHRLDKATGVVEMICDAPPQPHQQLFITYGEKGNDA